MHIMYLVCIKFTVVIKKYLITAHCPAGSTAVARLRIAVRISGPRASGNAKSYYISDRLKGKSPI